MRQIPTPVEQTSLHDVIATRLRDMIIQGELAAGTRINESELCPLLGVSRTPLREAIRTLASEGLVESIPRRGAVVRNFTAQDVRSMLEAVKILEQAAARLACVHATNADIEKIVVMHKSMKKLYVARKRMAYFKMNQAIHSAIVELSDNSTIGEMHDLVQSRLKRIRYMGNGAPEKWAAAMAEHDEMIVAIQNRDAEALAAVLGRHMDRTLERVADSI